MAEITLLTKSQYRFSNKSQYRFSNTGNPENAATEQVPGTVQPENVEGFGVKGQQQLHERGNSCVHV